MNEVSISGTILRCSPLRVTRTEPIRDVVTATVAVDLDPADGNRAPVDINATIFGVNAKQVADAPPGTAIELHGRLSSNQYRDVSGEARRDTRIIVDFVHVERPDLEPLAEDFADLAAAIDSTDLDNAEAVADLLTQLRAKTRPKPQDEPVDQEQPAKRRTAQPK